MNYREPGNQLEMRKNLSNDNLPEDRQSAIRFTRNEGIFQFYRLGSNTLALIGSHESWQVGIVVRLGQADYSPLFWGKRPMKLVERVKSPRFSRNSEVAPNNGARFYYHGPHMRYTMQVDVSLVFGRKTTNERRRRRMRTSSFINKTISRCEKFQIPSRCFRNDNFQRRQKITSSSRESRADVVVGGIDEDNVDGGTSSTVVQAALPLSLGGSPVVVPFINTLERSNERDERCGNTESSSSSNGVNVCTTSSTATPTIASTSLVPRLLGPVARSTLSSVTAVADGSDGNEAEGGLFELAADANVAQTNAWLRARRFQPFQATFASFSAADILRLSRDDLIQICGLADGIRLFNALHSKAPTPKLTLYFAMEGNTAVPWRVIYLENLNSNLFASKLIATLNLPHDRLQSVLIQGPQGVHVLVSNELVANIKDESMYLVEIIKDCSSDRYKLLLKPSPPPSPPSQPPPR